MRSNGNKSNKLFNMRGGGLHWNTWIIIYAFCCFCFFVTLIVFLVKRSNNDDTKNELVDTTWTTRDNMLLNRIILFGALSGLFLFLIFGVVVGLLVS